MKRDLKKLGALAVLLSAACGSTPALNDATIGDGDPANDASGDDAAPDDAAPDAILHPHGYIGAYASPSIVRGGTNFYAYFAADRVAGVHVNAPHATFTADGNWTYVGEALPHLGAQAFDGPGGYPVWAPATAQIDATHWMLYYTAQLVGSVAKKCIWRAHASSAAGPFVDDYAGPIECADASLWAIDPYLVKDAQSTWHLAARIDEAGGVNTIQIRDLDAQGDQFATGSSWHQLTQNQPGSWEQPVLENAGVVRIAPPTGAPHWFVFYSGRSWDDNTYAVGYADCGTGINGPCTKKTPDGPWLATDASSGVFGPGTPTFYTDAASDLMMSVQAWQYAGGTGNPQNSKGQIMRTYKVTVSDAYVPTATLVRVDK